MGKKGRPSKYKEEFVEQAFKLCLIGLIDEELAKVFDVSVPTLNKWKKDHPDFFKSIKRGRSGADGDVTKSLYHRACGYSHKEDKIFLNPNAGKKGEDATIIVETIKHYPPDPISCIFWLKNRQPAKWRDKVPEVVKDGDKAKPVEIKFVVKDASKKD